MQAQSKRRPRLERVTKVCPEDGTVFTVKGSHAATIWCSKACMVPGMRRRRWLEIETQFGEPIRDLIVRLYDVDHMGIKAIARKIGVSDRNLWDWFVALGIPRRSRTDAVALQWVDNEARRTATAATMRRVVAGIEPWNRNTEKRKTVGEKIRQAKLGPKNPMYNKFGPENPNWRGGADHPKDRRGPGWRTYREQTRRRDGYRCRLCGIGGRLEVHHIVAYKLTRDNSLGNLITLCQPCHVKVENGGVQLLRWAIDAWRPPAPAACMLRNCA